MARFAVRWYQGISSKLLERADEVVILFNGTDIEEIQELKRKVNRLVLRIAEDYGRTDQEIETIVSMNCPVQVDAFLSFDVGASLAKKGVYVMSSHEEPCKNIDDLTALVELGFKEIHIVGDLLFKVEQLSGALGKRGIKLRTCPFLAYGYGKEDTYYEVRKSFIRPEDIDVYAQFIDTFELFTKGLDNQKQEVYYEIYREQEQWFGNLREIIIGLECNLKSPFIIPRFAERRVKCGRKCFFGGSCNMCDTIKDFGDNLETIGVYVRNGGESDESDTV